MLQTRFRPGEKCCIQVRIKLDSNKIPDMSLVSVVSRVTRVTDTSNLSNLSNRQDMFMRFRLYYDFMPQFYP